MRHTEISILRTDVFTQYEMPFTVLKPHVVHPLYSDFRENLRDSTAICRGVNGLKWFNLGCIGTRTTAFKTVRFDEIAMQKMGTNVEPFDLASCLPRCDRIEEYHIKQP